MKHNFLKKLTAFLLVTVMLVALIPTFTLPAFATEDESASTPLIHTFDYSTGTNGTAAEDVTGTVSLTFGDGGNSNEPKWYSSGTAIRFYADNTLTVGATGYNIKKITFTVTSGGSFDANSGTIAENVWTPIQSVETVVFTNNTGSQVRIRTIVVELSAKTEECLHTNLDENCKCTNPNCGVVVHDFPAEPNTNITATCTAPGKTVYICTNCGSEQITATGTVSGHKYVDGVCTNDGCGSAEITSLKVGDTIYLVGQSSSKTQELIGVASNNIGSVGDLNGGSSYWFEIVAGATEGTIAFSVKGTDLYLASVNDNKLTTSTVKDDTSSWNVAQAEGGGLKISSVAHATRSLRFNAGSPRICGYTSGQSPVYAYAYEAPVEARSWNLALNEGVKINVKAFIPQAWIDANAGAKVGFYNGDADYTEVAPTAGEFTYSVTLKPTQFNNDMKFIIKDKAGATVVEKSVKIADYKTAVYETASKELQDLLNALTNVANAADSDATTVVGDMDADGLAAVDPNISREGEADVVNGYSGLLSNSASIGFIVNNKDYAGYKISAKRGSVVLVEDGNFVDYLEVDGIYTFLMITDLYAANYDDVIEITISNDTAAEKTSFKFNTYLSMLYQLPSSDDALKELVLATYLYGVAADAYVTAAA